MLAFIALIACATPGPTPAPEAPVSAQATEERVLVLDPSLLRWDDAAGEARFEEDANVQKAAYNVYVFDAKALESALGGRPTAPVTVRVAVRSAEERTSVPDDPTLPSPDGGFRITTIRADLLSVE